MFALCKGMIGCVQSVSNAIQFYYKEKCEIVDLELVLQIDTILNGYIDK